VDLSSRVKSAGAENGQVTFFMRASPFVFSAGLSRKKDEKSVFYEPRRVIIGEFPWGRRTGVLEKIHINGGRRSLLNMVFLLLPQ
jgi:hypothetical protein